MDWYHAAEYLSGVAQAAFDTEEKKEDWLKRTRKQLWQGEIEQVIASCGEHEKDSAATPWAKKAITYFTNN